MHMRQLLAWLCFALMTPVLLQPAQAGQDQPRARKPKARTAAKAPKVAEGPRLTPAELAAPYSAMRRAGVGPVPAQAGQGNRRPDLEDRYQSNATSWKLDLSLDPNRLEDASPLRLRLGREVVLDPVSKKELTPRADPLKAQQRLKELDLKGALENLGGKAEIQVDILKF